ncbi:MraY family glycosyltransferase [Sulfurovum sp. zt1-1]|uniref:MraY family glycosyltransferase n=1 Tax=Sulfurovum zhangzhouensis TaxID=3019067 RepID=A0ABT7QZY3_9BACT|nr:MraY family glycosyltransferase [Sulfurovum zhangzhouensis]MDM5272397.1 MraY family glycosyltransferase [Sulfurovum zhangzhouensis]
MTYAWELALSAFLISLTLQTITIKYSKKFNLFIDSHLDEKPQKFHDDSTPRAGGIGILLGMIAVLFTPIGWKLLISMILAFLSGIFEDFHRSMQPKVRLILQMIAAGAAILLTHSVITYLGLGIYLPYLIAIIFSIFSIVGLMNAMNIIDGFNGLASGATLLILFSLGHTALLVGDKGMIDMILIVWSAVFAFFIVNFPKGKIFLGDGGAYLIGFVVALIGIFLASTYPAISPWYILAILGYPVWEVLFSIYRKLRAGRSPLQPDAYHLHMLVYRHITKNNPLTSLVLLGGYAPFILLSSLFPHNSKANILILLIFIVCYVFFYRFLSKKENAR